MAAAKPAKKVVENINAGPKTEYFPINNAGRLGVLAGAQQSEIGDKEGTGAKHINQP